MIEEKRSPAEIIYQFLNVSVDDQNKFMCKKKSSSQLIYTKPILESKRTATLIKQACLFEMIADRLGSPKAPLYQFMSIEQKKIDKLQKISKLVVKKFEKNVEKVQYSDMEYCKKQLSIALHEQASFYYQLAKSAHQQTVNHMMTIPCTSLQEMLNYALILWQYEYGSQKNPQYKKDLIESNYNAIEKMHQLDFLGIQALPRIITEIVLYALRDNSKSLKGLGQDIARQMRFTYLTCDSQGLIEKGSSTIETNDVYKYIFASAEQFELILKTFLSHFNPEKKQFTESVLDAWKTSFNNFLHTLPVNLTNEKSEIIDSSESPDSENYVIRENFALCCTNFLNDVIEFKIPNDETKYYTKQLLKFLTTMTQEAYSIPFRSMKHALPPSLVIDKKYENTKVIYTFDDKSVILAGTQNWTIDNFPNCKIFASMQTIFDLPLVIAKSSKIKIKIDARSASKSEIADLKKLLKDPLEGCGFDVILYENQYETLLKTSSKK